MHKFNSINITGLDIDSHSDVIVKPCRNIGFTEVEITGSAKNIELISVKQVDNVIYILDNSLNIKSGFTIVSSNGNVIKFNGVTLSNISLSNEAISINNESISINGNNTSNLITNGKIINLDDFKDDNNTEDNIPIVITIYTSSIDLHLSLNQTAKFKSDVSFISCILYTKNSSLVHINSRNLEIKCSNSSFIDAELLGGDLVINASNSSQINTTGTYSSVRINASNSSNVNTKGHCLGNYKANASNSSYVCNEAKVDGKKTQNVSNSARIRL